MGVHEVRWCFHTTAMVSDYELTRDALIRLVGLRVLEDSRIENPGIGRRGGMTWVGDNIIEIGQPIVDGGAAERFVSRFGSHMSSIAVQVSDIDATVDFLAAKDAPVANRPEHPIVFTAPAGTAGVVIEWFGDEEPQDPRFGATIPPYAAEPLLDVTAMAFAGIVSPDPIAAAHRLADLFDRGVTFVHADAPAGSPVAGVSMGDMTLAAYAVPADADESLRLWGYAYRRAQTSSLGVLVPDLATAKRALEAAGVALVRSDAEQIVVDPDVTGGVVVVVVDELLPGDPRR